MKVIEKSMGTSFGYDSLYFGGNLASCYQAETSI